MSNVTGARALDPRKTERLGVAVFIAALLLQLPLILNPGYFSHDELQWAHYAQAGVVVPWGDLATFQYRPLTFNLWMALSRGLFETPMLFHAVLVGWGSLNAALLFAVARGFGMHAWPAMFGALVFAISPYAVYVHGWVGCIGDLIWLSCALLLAWSIQRGNTWVAGMFGALLTATALLGKEAAFAIPPLLATAWLFDGRRPKWLVAMLAAGAVCAIYLALRLDVLLHAPREGGQYALSVSHVPVRWLEYQLFPPSITVMETFSTLRRVPTALLAGVLWLALAGALWQASRRHLALFLVGGVAALLPVLPMASSFNHYAYGFAAVSCMACASAWPVATRQGRVVIGLCAALAGLHGAYVMTGIHMVGRMQDRFSPALAQAVRADASGGQVTLRLHPQSKEWVFQRLSHQIPSYDGIAIGDRVRIVGAGADADYEILPDGRLQPLR